MTISTPATRAGLSIGDVVIVGRGFKCPHDLIVGDTAVFDRDDGTNSPFFVQYGRGQFLDLTEITIQPKALTPAQKAGLKVGDVVEVQEGTLGDGYFNGEVFLKKDDGSSMPLFGDHSGQTLWLSLSEVTLASAVKRTPCEQAGLKVGDEVIIENARIRGFHGRTFLLQDDGTRIPRFRDELGRSHFVTLLDVKKAPAGPETGVSWADAPKGATHYSLDGTYISKWHKQNEDGSFAFSDTFGFTTYPAHAQRSVVLDKMIPMPGVTTKANLTLVLADMKAAQKEVDAAQATLDAKKAVVEDHVDTIRNAGFHVAGGNLVKEVPVSMWKTGDKVKCVKRDTGLADLTVGKEYTVHMRGQSPAIIDDVGDQMAGCVERGCFQFVRSAK
jgi:hypothetical protein